MGRFIVKFEDGNDSWYLEWSTIVDAPITYGMSKEEFFEYYKDEYGRQGLSDLDKRMKRVEEKGTSALTYSSVDTLISCNRAGLKESCLSKEQIIDFYCKNQPSDESCLPPLGKFFEEDE